MKHRTDSTSSDDFELTIDGPLPTLIADGTYDATVIQIEKVTRFNRPMVQLTFRLAMPPHEGAKLQGFAALQANGKIAPGSKLTHWWVLIADYEKLARRDRIAMRMFKMYLFQVSVGTVTKNHLQEDVPESARRSVVREIIGIVGKAKP